LVYSITTSTHNRQPIFADLYNARALIHCLAQSDRELLTYTLAWVVMPDHLHWLFQLGNTASLSKTINLMKGRSSRKIADIERVWQPGFYDRSIRKNEDLKSVARYIVANPLRASLVKQLEDYPHWDAVWLSSNHANISDYLW
jgi:REP element-mobilizing transposase RayT